MHRELKTTLFIWLLLFCTVQSNYTFAQNKSEGTDVIPEYLNSDVSVPVESTQVITTENAGVNSDDYSSATPGKVPGAFKMNKLNVAISAILKKTGDVVPVIRDGVTSGVLFLKKSRMHALKTGVLLFSLIIIFTTILFYLQKKERQRFMTTTRLSVMDKEVQRACRYIELNFAVCQLSSEMLCEELVTGKAFLEALFQKELGMKIENFIEQVRINRAKILLNKNPLLTLEEIAIETGFEDSAKFAQTFQNIAGISYEAYKNSLPSTQTA